MFDRVRIGAVLTALVVLNGPTVLAANKVNVTFNDALSIKSDGKGKYEHGKRGVNSTFTSAGDWVFTLNVLSTRSFSVDLRSPVDPQNAPLGGLYSCTWLKHSFLKVYGVKSVPVGATEFRQATFGLEKYTAQQVQYYRSIWFGFHGQYAPDDPTPGVAVTRLSPTLWVLRLDAGVPYGEIGRVDESYANGSGGWNFNFSANYYLPAEIVLEEK
jgi:hypothetical protein